MQLKALMLSLVAVFVFSLSGCAKEEGTMEKMGKNLDEAAESAAKSAEDAADDVKDALEE